MSHYLLTTLCMGLSMCSAAPETPAPQQQRETAHMPLEALPKKEAKAHEAYARKIRAAAQACASIRVNTHRIRRKNPEMREYTLSDSKKNELCRILSAVQPLKYKEHVFISPSRQTTISLLDAKGNTLCRILEWDIGRLSFITQHNEVIISEEDYKRFMEIVK